MVAERDVWIQIYWKICISLNVSDDLRLKLLELDKVFQYNSLFWEII